MRQWLFFNKIKCYSDAPCHSKKSPHMFFNHQPSLAWSAACYTGVLLPSVEFCLKKLMSPKVSKEVHLVFGGIAYIRIRCLENLRNISSQMVVNNQDICHPDLRFAWKGSAWKKLKKTSSPKWWWRFFWWWKSYGFRSSGNQKNCQLNSTNPRLDREGWSGLPDFFADPKNPPCQAEKSLGP